MLVKNITLFGLCFFLSLYFLYNNNYSVSIPAHVDEPSVVETAIRISNGTLNPKFFRYPSGHMNSLAIIYKIAGYFSEKLTLKNYYEMAWGFSRFCIAGITAMVFLICTINMNVYFGILGSTLVILNPLLKSHANFAIVDVPMAFFVTLFFLILTIIYSKSYWHLKYIILLAIITGIAIAMKYTAALLIPVLLFVSADYVHKKRKYILPIKQIKKVLIGLGIIFLMVSAMTKIYQQSLLVYFMGLTTDGILEIEYIQTLSHLSSFIMIFGILLIFFSQWNKLVQSDWVSFLISPFHLFAIFIAIISFVFFSPYTLIEWKISFADFMYEYRHMKIGSAAQYHHQSDEYIKLISNLTATASGIFYLKLFINSFGITGLLLGIYGMVELYLRKPKYAMSLLVYLFLVLITLFSWKNVAIRYTLSILPLMVVCLTYGLYSLKNIIANKFGVFNKWNF